MPGGTHAQRSGACGIEPAGGEAPQEAAGLPGLFTEGASCSMCSNTCSSCSRWEFNDMLLFFRCLSKMKCERFGAKGEKFGRKCERFGAKGEKFGQRAEV